MEPHEVERGRSEEVVDHGILTKGWGFRASARRPLTEHIRPAVLRGSPDPDGALRMDGPREGGNHAWLHRRCPARTMPENADLPRDGSRRGRAGGSERTPGGRQDQ